jgi:hypothetical protein
LRILSLHLGQVPISFSFGDTVWVYLTSK